MGNSLQKSLTSRDTMYYYYVKEFDFNKTLNEILKDIYYERYLDAASNTAHYIFKYRILFDVPSSDENINKEILTNIIIKYGRYLKKAFEDCGYEPSNERYQELVKYYNMIATNENNLRSEIINCIFKIYIN